jgi:hypothetical protein
MRIKAYQEAMKEMDAEIIACTDSLYPESWNMPQMLLAHSSYRVGFMLRSCYIIGVADA